MDKYNLYGRYRKFLLFLFFLPMLWIASHSGYGISYTVMSTLPALLSCILLIKKYWCNEIIHWYEYSLPPYISVILSAMGFFVLTILYPEEYPISNINVFMLLISLAISNLISSTILSLFILFKKVKKIKLTDLLLLLPPIFLSSWILLKYIL